MQALELTRLLHGSGKYELYLASLKADGVLRSSIAGLNLGEVSSYPLKRFYDRNAVIQLRRFVHHLRSSRIDVLHTHDFYTNIFGMTAGFLAGVTVRIASCRETGGMRSAATSTKASLHPGPSCCGQFRIGPPKAYRTTGQQ